jgi:hypothetical protein
MPGSTAAAVAALASEMEVREATAEALGVSVRRVDRDARVMSTGISFRSVARGAAREDAAARPYTVRVKGTTVHAATLDEAEQQREALLCPADDPASADEKRQRTMRSAEWRLAASQRLRARPKAQRRKIKQAARKAHTTKAKRRLRTAPSVAQPYERSVRARRLMWKRVRTGEPRLLMWSHGKNQRVCYVNKNGTLRTLRDPDALKRRVAQAVP